MLVKAKSAAGIGAASVVIAVLGCTGPPGTTANVPPESPASTAANGTATVSPDAEAARVRDFISARLGGCWEPPGEGDFSGAYQTQNWWTKGDKQHCDSGTNALRLEWFHSPSRARDAATFGTENLAYYQTGTLGLTVFQQATPKVAQVVAEVPGLERVPT